MITSGGVSVGEADYVKETLDTLGAVGFWKIAMKPGKPLAFGQVGDAVFFGLPGNPVSAYVSFEFFVRPTIRRLQGRRDLSRPRISAAPRFARNTRGSSPTCIMEATNSNPREWPSVKRSSS